MNDNYYGEYKMYEDLKGKNILVTGASSGIGLAVARMLDSYGANTVMVARRLHILEEEIAKMKGKHLAYSYDLTDYENILDIFSFCNENGIKLDGLVYCAGMSNTCPIRINDTKQMLDIMAVNYFSYVEMMKYFAKKKYANDNSTIVAISSVEVKTCDKGMTTYSASKAAMEAAARVASKELVSRNTRVLCIAPGWVDTQLASDEMKLLMKEISTVTQKQPLGVMPPESIADLVCYLISVRGRYFTGSSLEVGGRLL